jgi:hypothetical protein
MASLMIIVVLLSLSPPEDAIAGAETAFSGRERIEALVVDSDGEAISGVGLSLCPLESDQVHARGTEDNQCLFRASGIDGRAVFEVVAPGLYRLTGNLTGFADTTVSPLSIAVRDLGPLAPDRVTLLLNPVCDGC